MAEFIFTSPDGKKFRVKGPDGSTPEQAFQIFQSSQPPKTPDNSAGQWAGVAARAAAPYAAAMGAGAAGGAMVLGPPGAAIGAIGAPLALGAADLGTALYNVVGPRLGGPRAPTPSETIQDLAARVGIGSKPQTPEQAMLESAVAGGLGGGGSAVAARTLAPSLQGVPQRVANALAPAPVLQAAGGAAGAGAATMAQTTGGLDPNTWTGQLGTLGAGLVGGSLPVMARGGMDLGRRATQASINKLSDIWDPKQAMYRDAMGPNPQAVINALDAGAVSPVPGYNRTAVQAVQDINAPTFSAFGGRALRQNPEAFADRMTQQNQALRGALRNEVAGTPQELAALEAQRAATAGGLYKQADPQLVTPDATFMKLAERPAVVKAVQAAQRVAGEQATPIMTPDGRMTVQGLHLVKMALDDMVRNPQDHGLAKFETSAIRGTRTQFLSWLESKSDVYKNARSEFKTQSGPINEREVGQYLMQKLTSPMSEDAPLRGPQFAGAIREAPATLKRATGEARFSELGDVLTPKQVQTVENIKAELMRDTKARQQLLLGSDRAPDPVKAIDNVSGDKVQLWSRAVSIANNVFDRFKGKVNEQMAMEIAKDLLSPKVTAQRLREAQAAANARQFGSLRPKGGAGPTFATSQVQNALAGIAGTPQNALVTP